MAAKIKPVQINDQKPKDELFALVKALSQNEKRYIKMFSSHGNSELLYLQLFDALDAEEVYVEKEFLAKHAGKPFIRNFGPAKRFLKLAILRAMRAYHEDRFLHQEVTACLQNFRFLYEKGLYASARKQLVTARKKAEQGQLDLALLEINERETTFLFEQSLKASDLLQQLHRLQTEQKHILERLQLTYLFTNSYHRLFLEYRQGRGLSLRDLVAPHLPVEDLETTLHHLEDHPFATQLAALHIQALLVRDNRQLQESRLVYRRILDLFRRHGRDRGEYLSHYCRVFSNYLSFCHQTQEYDEFEALLEEMRGLLKSSKIPDQRGEILQNLLLYEAVFRMNTQQWEAARSIPQQVRQLFLHHGRKINKPREITLSFNCMVIWFFNEDWQAMKPWIDHLLQGDKSGFLVEATHTARIMEMIYHFERHHHDLIPYLRRSVGRKIQFPLHKELVHQLARINDTPLLERADGMRELAAFIERQLQARQPETPLAGLTEMYYWAQARARGWSLIQTFQTLPPPPSP